jgi:hypothetical protein
MFDLTLKQKIKDNLRAAENGYAWPGGYPVFAIMADGGCLCAECVKENRRLIYLNSIDYHFYEMDGHKYSEFMGTKEWTIAGAEINWEDMELSCDNCYLEIECAYPDESKRQYSDEK